MTLTLVEVCGAAQYAERPREAHREDRSQELRRARQYSTDQGWWTLPSQEQGSSPHLLVHCSLDISGRFSAWKHASCSGGGRMQLDQRLVDATIALMNTRFPEAQWGWGCGCGDVHP